MASPSNPPTPENIEKSRAFLTVPKDQTLQKHPELSSAYAVRDELQKIARDAKPYNDTVRIQVDNTIQKSVAAAVARGQEPTIGDQARNNVRFQVAYASAEHVAGARRIDPSSKANISGEHREILIKHAESSAQTSANSRKPEVAELQTRARETAGLVGLLDMPKTDNPFKAEALKAAYTQQQQELRDRQTQQARGAQKGFDRG